MKALWFEGDYAERQGRANAARVSCYIEGHFNSSAAPTANYACVVTAKAAGEITREWAKSIAQGIAQEFAIPLGGDGGVLVGGWHGRGDYNLRFVRPPAIIVEPWFISNPTGALWAKDDTTLKALARILADSIEAFFPGSESVGLSIGHKGKVSAPKDMGALVLGGGSEAECAERYLKALADLVEEFRV